MGMMLKNTISNLNQIYLKINKPIQHRINKSYNKKLIYLGKTIFHKNILFSDLELFFLLHFFNYLKNILNFII